MHGFLLFSDYVQFSNYVLMSSELIGSQPSCPLHRVPRVVAIARFACWCGALVNSSLSLDILDPKVVSCYSPSKLPAFRPVGVLRLHLLRTSYQNYSDANFNLFEHVRQYPCTLINVVNIFLVRNSVVSDVHLTRRYQDEASLVVIRLLNLAFHHHQTSVEEPKYPWHPSLGN